MDRSNCNRPPGDLVFNALWALKLPELNQSGFRDAMVLHMVATPRETVLLRNDGVGL